jgi:hypothetical protein
MAHLGFLNLIALMRLGITMSWSTYYTKVYNWDGFNPAMVSIFIYKEVT